MSCRHAYDYDYHNDNKWGGGGVGGSAPLIKKVGGGGFSPLFRHTKSRGDQSSFRFSDSFRLVNECILNGGWLPFYLMHLKIAIKIGCSDLRGFGLKEFGLQWNLC